MFSATSTPGFYNRLPLEMTIDASASITREGKKEQCPQCDSTGSVPECGNVSVLGCRSLRSLHSSPRAGIIFFLIREHLDAYMCGHRINCHRDCLYGQAGEQLPLKEELPDERLMCLTPSHRAANAEYKATVGRRIRRIRHFSNVDGIRCSYLSPMSALVAMPGTHLAVLCVPGPSILGS